MAGGMWEYAHSKDDWNDRRLVGYKVEATDGNIGKVDDATNEANMQSFVVDTGPWILGSKVVLPAGLIERVDHDDGKVYVAATKDQVKESPDFNDEGPMDPVRQKRLGDYYEDFRRKL